MDESEFTRPSDAELAILQVLFVGQGLLAVVARALFAMEEQRSRAVLGVAANGGSLRQRVLRLMAPASSIRRPAEAGWAGAGLIAAVTGLVAMAWLAIPTQAQDNDARPSVRGRVLDDAGQPVAGARVRLYRRENSWERSNRVVEEATAGPDGAYRLNTPLKPRLRPEPESLPPYVLVADRPGKAVGWRTIPRQSATFEGDIILTAPSERTMTVIDTDGHPVAGVRLTTSIMGNLSSPLPYFQDRLILRSDDQPPTAVTGADGRATVTQLPKTEAWFIATKPGFAESYASPNQATIRLTPGAALSGRVTDPDGKPLAGVTVVLYTAFMWHFERTVTDAQGQYHFEDLMARGWDMSGFTKGMKANGQYQIWLEADRFVMPTKTLTLEPNTKQTLDIKAIEGGVIRVTLLESETSKPVANARIWGFDAETRTSARFDAHTDEQGQVTFRSAPSKISLHLAGPPDGVYLEGDLRDDPDAHAIFDFPGGEADVRLVMPPIAGPLISLSGVCILPEGAPAVDLRVNASASRFMTSTSMSHQIPHRRTDRQGKFTLDDVPAGQSLQIYAETPDRRFAAATTIETPDEADPGFRMTVNLVPTVTVDYQFVGEGGKPLASRKIQISPKVGGQEFPLPRRIVESDAEGRVKIDGVLPGLSYKIVEDVPPREGPILMRADGRPPWYEEVLILAPAGGK